MDPRELERAWPAAEPPEDFSARVVERTLQDLSAAEPAPSRARMRAWFAPRRSVALSLAAGLLLVGAWFVRWYATERDDTVASAHPKAVARPVERPGEAGGFVGGGVGGVVGSSSPPPPKSTGAKLLSAKAGHSLLAINPQVRPYKVDVPAEYAGRGEEFITTLSICVSPDGSVSSVEILKPSIPVIDLQLAKVIPRWKYHPYMVDGQPTGFCYSMSYRVR